MHSPWSPALSAKKGTEPLSVPSGALPLPEVPKGRVAKAAAWTSKGKNHKDANQNVTVNEMTTTSPSV